MRKFILVRKKGGKTPIAAIPLRKNTTTTKLKKIILAVFRSGFSFRVVSETQLKRLILSKRKPTTRSRTKHKKVTRHRRRRVHRKRKK